MSKTDNAQFYLWTRSFNRYAFVAARKLSPLSRFYICNLGLIKIFTPLYAIFAHVNIRHM